MESSLTHVMLVSFPAQGHINPLLRLGKLIASKGLLVTFVTTEYPCGKKMRQVNKIEDGVVKPVGSGFLRFEFIDDGFYDDRVKNTKADFDLVRKECEVLGKREIKKLLMRYKEEEKQPVTCLVKDAFMPWICDVAEDEELQIPSAVLWVQSSACFAAYYYYHHQLVKFPTKTEPELNVEIPFMPFVLKHDEIPTTLSPFPSQSITFGEMVLEQMKRLEKPFSLLIDSFQELERDIIDHMSQLCPQLISPIGPLFMMGKTLSSDIKGDISDFTDECMEWLDSKEPSSVVYISFGTVVHLKQEQMDEIAHGLLNSGLSFLWVVRPPMEILDLEPHVLRKGKSWNGVHKRKCWLTLACFLSHCGWNSTMEALSSGIPVVCFPQCGDQLTDAVYLVDVFKTGVRLGRGESEENIVAEKLLEVTVGEKALELRENARRWKEEAEAAVAYGGSSDMNFQAFVDKLVAVKDNVKH